jgi:hypothetical protein
LHVNDIRYIRQSKLAFHQKSPFLRSSKFCTWKYALWAWVDRMLV